MYSYSPGSKKFWSKETCFACLTRHYQINLNIEHRFHTIHANVGNAELRSHQT